MKKIALYKFTVQLGEGLQVPTDETHNNCFFL